MSTRPGVQPATPVDPAAAGARCVEPLVVWDPRSARIILANGATSELVGRPLEDLLGRSIFDLVTERSLGQRAAAGLEAGALDVYEAERLVVRRGADSVPARVWTRAIEVGGVRCALTLALPTDELDRMSRPPTWPWRDLANLVVGEAGPGAKMSGLSVEARAVFGYEPSELEGRPLTALVEPADVSRLVFSGRSLNPRNYPDIRMLRRDGSPLQADLLIGHHPQCAPGAVSFAVVTPRPVTAADLADRVRELELRLRRIGAEVQATGALDSITPMPSVGHRPELGDLTDRQWEILSRLLNGERVKGIAGAMYLSESTVRNHLSAIFRKFGVHSQGELVAHLRQSPVDSGSRIP